MVHRFCDEVATRCLAEEAVYGRRSHIHFYPGIPGNLEAFKAAESPAEVADSEIQEDVNGGYVISFDGRRFRKPPLRARHSNRVSRFGMLPVRFDHVEGSFHIVGQQTGQRVRNVCTSKSVQIAESVVKDGAQILQAGEQTQYRIVRTSLPSPARSAR